MQHIRILTLGDAKVRAIVLRGLRGVAAALARGDGERAAAAMEDNLREARKAFIAAADLDRAPGAGERGANDGLEVRNGRTGDIDSSNGARRATRAAKPAANGRASNARAHGATPRPRRSSKT